MNKRAHVFEGYFRSASYPMLLLKRYADGVIAKRQSISVSQVESASTTNSKKK